MEPERSANPTRRSSDQEFLRSLKSHNFLRHFSRPSDGISSCAVPADSRPVAGAIPRTDLAVNPREVPDANVSRHQHAAHHWRMVCLPVVLLGRVFIESGNTARVSGGEARVGHLLI